jgi:hypothetical protein
MPELGFIFPGSDIPFVPQEIVLFVESSTHTKIIASPGTNEFTIF